MRRLGTDEGFWRVHLTTAFAAMCLSGGLLGLNITQSGWPIPMLGGAPEQGQTVLLNVLICGVLVFLLVAVLEWRVRQCEARER